MAKKKEIKKIDISKLSLSQELFILRECIDFLALGLPVDQQVIDKCYEDLSNAIAEYNYIKNEEIFDDFLDFDNIDFSNSNLDSAKQIFGETNVNKLEEGIDSLNEKFGTNFLIFVDKSNSKTKLKIYENDLLKRIYQDKYDLELNLDADLFSRFSRQKIEFSNKTLSSNKKNNIE